MSVAVSVCRFTSTTAIHLHSMPTTWRLETSVKSNHRSQKPIIARQDVTAIPFHINMTSIAYIPFTNDSQWANKSNQKSITSSNKNQTINNPKYIPNQINNKINQN